MVDIKYEKGDSRIKIAQGFFDEGLSPEEWVRQNRDQIGCWSLDEVEYEDPELKKWIMKVTELLLG
ncbi:MAG TPA: hypothetical protein PKI93_08415 [Alphaproteobacteria bacterium]|nr:hypothetical protein [Alphaproteobacteria bacterium]HNS44896.1 hypothetical protein [Alphaproteobacteria bacterium]